MCPESDMAAGTWDLLTRVRELLSIVNRSLNERKATEMRRETKVKKMKKKKERKNKQ